MPPLSLTQSKYAFAMTGMSVKSVPGCFVAMAPSLMGAPFAFFPVPRPQTDVAAASTPEPTVGAAPVPVAHAVGISARRPMAAHATPILIVFDLIRFLLWFSTFA